MTLTLIPSGPRFSGSDRELPVGLTVLDAARIAAAVDAGRTDSTLAVYASAWRRWENWCAARRVTPLPATAPMVCAYLTDCAERGLAYASLDQACAAIGYRHRRDGADNPIDCELVRQVRRGLRRTLGSAPRRQARPLGPAEIRQILAGIDRGTAKGARDAALILLGFASALRRSELAALTLADVEAMPTGLLLTVRRSKTDPAARGQVVGVARGRHAVAALDAWIAVRGRVPGVLFTSLRGGHVSLDPISGNAIARLLKTRARAAGLPTERITAHSLRAGHATTAALAGVGVERIAAQTRHRSITTLIEHYIRPLQALQTTSSRELGL